MIYRFCLLLCVLRVYARDSLARVISLRFCLLLCVLCASARVSLAQVIPLRWDVETSRPPSYGITLYRGESLNLEPRFLSYSEPLDLSDILSVEFRYRSADMAAETYYRIVGALHPSNAGRVRIPWVPRAAGQLHSDLANLPQVQGHA
jgi:hypothetical protein